MHLAAFHPDLTPGTIIERGQEIGLMGGTAVQRDRPHLHLDIEDENGDRIDPSTHLGINDSGELLSPPQGPDC
jgi:murein DD-endopeptidase MepM/ murein hydrolase activator NlpD